MANALSRMGSVKLGLLCLMLIAATSAFAFEPVAQSVYEIPLPEWDLHGYSSYSRDVGAAEVTSRLTARYGSDWHVFSWNPVTDTPRFAFGTSVKVAEAITDAAQLEGIARRVIADNAAALRAEQDNLRLAATPHAVGKWAAHFQQTYHGLDVWEGGVEMVFSESGKLMLLGSEFHGGIDIDPNPTLGLNRAKEIARFNLPYDGATDRVEAEGTLLVLPVAVTPEDAEYHLVWRVRVHTRDPLGDWVTHVDAHTGEIVWRYNDIHFAYGGGTVSDVEPITYCDGVVQETMPHLRVQVSGLGIVYTDTAGDWSIAGSGGSHAVTCDLFGPYVDTINVAGAEASFTGTVYDGVPLQVFFDDSNSQADERDVFDAINDVHDFFETIDPGYGYTNTRISAFVSRTDGVCPGNAWWNGSLNMCAGTSYYGNTGRIEGIVIHEYGHGIQDDLIGWQGNQGLGEGNADITATYLTQDHEMGRGFYTSECEEGTRDALNTLVYPDNVIGVEIHAAGQVILGFNWDSMMLLEDLYGFEEGRRVAASNWHFGRMLMHPTTQPAQVLATFTADDNDGNLANGTPHHAIYCEAATNHGFDCPEITEGVMFTHDLLPDTEDTNHGYTLNAQIWSTEDDIDDATVTMSYRVDGGPWTEVPMTHGVGNLYSAMVPAQDGGVVEYYFAATDLTGLSGVLPSMAPAVGLKFLVAWEADDMDDENGWTVGDTDDDATSGVWERAEPVPVYQTGYVIQPEEDHTPGDRGKCFITENGVEGGSPFVQDVDGGKTTLFSPIYDLSEARSASISYWKFYTNSHGGVPNQDFWDVDISNDGGETWVEIEHTVDDTNGWENIFFDLEEYFAVFGQVQLRFIASDEGTDTLLDAGVDDFAIVAAFGGTGVGDDVTVAFTPRLGQNHPNPFNPMTKISFALPEAGLASLKVFDAQGRLVKTLSAGRLDAGAHEITWDGRDDAGHPLSSGVYFYRLRAENINLSKRMILVK